MKRILIALVVCALMATPALAGPTIEFSPGGTSAGNWSYNGLGTFSFSQTIDVDTGLGNPADALVGAWVYIPNLSVGGIPGGPYTLTPVTSTITIKSADGLTTYLTGTLGGGDLVPVGSTGVGYSLFQTDISSITINNTIGSNALAYIAAMANPMLDFELSLQGAGNFKNMLDNGLTGSDGFSGAMTAIPAPGAILLGSIGVAFVGWLRRRRTL